MQLRKILFIGPPGSGKGTQSKLLSQYELTQISTGDLIRRAWREEDSGIMQYKSHIENGGFLPDREIFELIYKEIGNLSGAKGYILDGAIRNVSQARTALQKNLVGEVLFFELSEEEAMKRLRKRFLIEGRKDDSPEAISRRIMEYKTQTEPAILYMIENGMFVNPVNASQSKENIHREILEILDIAK